LPVINLLGSQNHKSN